MEVNPVIQSSHIFSLMIMEFMFDVHIHTPRGEHYIRAMSSFRRMFSMSDTLEINY